MSSEGTERQRRVHPGSSTVDNSTLVHRIDDIIDRLSLSTTEIRQPTDNGEFRQETSTDTQITTDGLSAIRGSFKDRNISVKATNILLASWRKGTQKQYITYIKKWFTFCREKQIDSVQANISSILEYLTELYESGCGYSVINTARCALSAIGIVKEGFAVGAHPLIVRFMKGVFNLKPTKSRYCETWDVSTVLLYLQKLSPVSKLSLKLLSLKLAMLIALTLASRTQSIHLLDIRNMKKGYDVYTLFYRDLLKQSRPGKGNPVAELKAYPCDRRLCVIFALKEYLKRTQEIRGSKTSLFLSYIKPHGEITKDTISRWLRTVMYNSGIDCDKFKVHSIRSASTSKAKLNFVPVDKIISVAGWSNTKTFATYYNKPIKTDTGAYTEAVLKL